jgi:hypothetical protein
MDVLHPIGADGESAVARGTGTHEFVFPQHGPNLSQAFSFGIPPLPVSEGVIRGSSISHRDVTDWR